MYSCEDEEKAVVVAAEERACNPKLREDIIWAKVNELKIGLDTYWAGEKFVFIMFFPRLSRVSFQLRFKNQGYLINLKRSSRQKKKTFMVNITQITLYNIFILLKRKLM